MSDLDFVSQLRKAFGFFEVKKEKKIKQGNKKLKDLGVTVRPKNYDAVRVEEMYRLRYISKWTLQEIADKYNISRERVRQLIGNSGAGYKPERIKSEVQSHPELTNEELAARTGYSESTIGTLRNGERHAIKENTLMGLGTKAEETVSTKLAREGIGNKLMPHHHSFDILLSNGKRVDVKSRINKSIPPSAKHRQITAQWKFDCRKSKKGDYADFFILYLWETGDFFIVPNEAVGTCLIAFAWPATHRASKWHQYHNRFDLLKGE
jgi:transcriptional regulator with XRE-family HTH domain